MKEIRGRTRLIGFFPDGKSALILLAARLRHIAGSTWSERKYLNMHLLGAWEKEDKASWFRILKFEENELAIRFLTLPQTGDGPSMGTIQNMEFPAHSRDGASMHPKHGSQ